MPEADPTLTLPVAARRAPSLSRNAGEGGARSASGEGDAAEPLAIYIHWPFCVSKCPYCDFNSHVRERIDAARWTRALVADLDAEAALAPGREVGSVFFGGGTPSLMPPETVAALLDRVRTRWPVAADVEITLEANPNSAEAGRFRLYQAAGVNRVSLGVQSLDPEALQALGRRHDRGEALAAIELARRIFPRFSFDLIYARPGQSVGAWLAELDEALGLAGDHLSLYQLTIEPGTAFATRHARGELVVPGEEDAAALFEATQARMEKAGLPAYEISNHARPGGESRHNLAYWRSQDYLGIGPGAHGRIRRAGVRWATSRRRAPEAWLAAVEATGSGAEPLKPLDRDTEIDEMLMMGLRLVEGIARDRLEERLGEPVEARFGDALDRLRGGGFITLDDGRLAATAAGRQRLDAVLAALLG